MLGNLDKDLGIIYGVWIFVIASSILFLPLISASPDLTDGLVSYWKLDESSGNAIDELGANDGVPVNVAQGATGKINDCYDFDGTDDRITIGAGTSLSFGGNMTISVWIFIDTDSTGERVILRDWGGTTRNFMFEIYDPVTDLVWAKSGNGGSSEDTVVNAAITQNAWHHVVYRRDVTGNNLSVFIDGDLANSGVINYNGAATNNQIDIGWVGVSSSLEFEGLIDEMYVSNRSLTDAEILELYADNAGNSYPFVADTCTCAGAGNDWEIDMSDYCNITEACDLTTGTLSFTGSGNVTCDAKIETTNMGDVGSGGIFLVNDECEVLIS